MTLWFYNYKSVLWHHYNGFLNSRQDLFQPSHSFLLLKYDASGPLMAGPFSACHRIYIMFLCWATFENAPPCTIFDNPGCYPENISYLGLPSYCMIGWVSCYVIPRYIHQPIGGYALMLYKNLSPLLDVSTVDLQLCKYHYKWSKMVISPLTYSIWPAQFG